MGSTAQRRRSSAATRLRTVLDDEFSRRKRMNPRYSLRAFARSMEIEHSTLTQLKRGKRTLTWNSIRLIASRLRWRGTAILRLSNRGQGFDSRKIARQLGISVDDVNVALTDLCQFGLIELKGE